MGPANRSPLTERGAMLRSCESRSEAITPLSDRDIIGLGTKYRIPVAGEAMQRDGDLRRRDEPIRIC